MVTRSETPQFPPTILPTALVNAHALSFEHQPLLASLFRELQGTRRDLVIIAGAGVSIDAGLPSWPDLLEQIERKYADPGLIKALSLSQSDSIQRRGTVAMSLATRGRQLGREYEVIRDSLFKTSVPQPGNLAAAIARLAAVYHGRVRVVTTNYDPLLEIALNPASEDTSLYAYSLDGEISGTRGKDGTPTERSFDAWYALDGDDERRSVLHLHGKVPVASDDAALGPLVLTESAYFAHGERVSERLAEVLKDRTALFLGLSMTDPNLLAALRIMKERGWQGTRYAITVPSLYRDDLRPQECAEYSCAVAGAIRDAFDVLPILLKTYSQTIQLVSELGLAVRIGRRYGVTPGGRNSTLRYGSRMRTALKVWYEAVGYDAARRRFNQRSSQLVSAELNRAVHARDGAASYLETKSRRYTGLVAPNEQVALFLWLRDIDDFRRTQRGAQQADESFGLRLIVSSAYHHWEEWSSKRVEPVAGDSKWAPVQAVFQGQTAATNFRVSENSGNWLGAYAIPLRTGVLPDRVNEEDLDQLILGAISVHSTSFIKDDDIRTQYLAKGGAGTREYTALSVITQLDPEELEEFHDRLISAVVRALNALG